MHVKLHHDLDAARRPTEVVVHIEQQLCKGSGTDLESWSSAVSGTRGVGVGFFPNYDVLQNVVQSPKALLREYRIRIAGCACKALSMTTALATLSQSL